MKSVSTRMYANRGGYAWALLLALACIAACLLGSTAAQAAWSTDPAVNTAVSTAAGKQCRPQIVYAGQGSYFAVWRDQATPGIFAQKYNASGDPQWGAAGKTVCSADRSNVEAVADGQGGLIVSWNNDDDDVDYCFAQRLNSNGNPVWEAEGIPILPSGEGWLAPDGSGGAIVMSYNDAYINRVSASGELLWGDKDNPLEYSANAGYGPKIVPDGAGGAVFTWYENDGDNYNIAVQRVDKDGNFLWNGGDPLFLTTAGENECPRIVPGPNHGAIVVWYNYDGAVSYSVRGQRIDGDGTVLWDDEGVVITSTTNLYSDSLDLASDRAGGAFFTWADASDNTVYAHYVDADGELAWDSAVMLSLAGEFSDTAQHPRKTVEDGRGGFITGWYNGDFELKAQRCDADGNVLWGEGGLVLSTGVSITYGPRLTSNGQGGAVAIWVDTRGESGQDIFIQGVDADGELGNPGYSEPAEDTWHHSSHDGLCFIGTAMAAAPAPGGLMLLIAAWMGAFALGRRRTR